MMIECYFDDSSDDRRAKYYACGGLLGSQEQWDFFDILWHTHTHSLKEPFRAANCEGGHGQFEDWPKPMRDDLMARLVNVIYGVRLFGFASVVPVAEFECVFPSLGKERAFGLAATQAIFNAAHIADRVGMDVHLWFEQGQIGIVSSAYESVRMLNWKPAQRLRGISFDTKHLRPLQGADLIAREAYKHMDNLGVRPTRIPIHEMWENLFFMLWTEGSLRYVAAQGWPENPECLAKFSDPPPGARIQHFWEKSWAYHEQKAKSIRELSSGHGSPTESAARGDQGEAGRGESGEKAEES